MIDRNKPLNIVDDIKKYIDLKLEYLQLSFIEKVSLLVAKMALMTFVAVLSLALILLLVLLSYNLLMQWIGIAWIVTLIEIGIVALLIILLWCFRNRLIIKPVANAVIRILIDSSNLDNMEDDK